MAALGVVPDRCSREMSTPNPNHGGTSRSARRGATGAPCSAEEPAQYGSLGVPRTIRRWLPNNAARMSCPLRSRTVRPAGGRLMTAPLVWQVIWIGADGHGLGACGHRNSDADEATLCPFEPATLPEVCA